MKFDWLKSLKNSQIAKKRRRQAPAYRPAAETLDQRVLLSSVNGVVDPGDSTDSGEKADFTNTSDSSDSPGKLSGGGGGSSAAMESGDNPALALVDPAQATHVVVASGDWTNPNTWQDGILPGDGARVFIPMGLNVTVDSTIPQEFKTLRVDGKLSFQTDVNTELRVDTLVVAHHGQFEMGTAANPIQSDVTARVVFADDGVIDRTWDPTQISRGAIFMGQTEIHGATSTHREALATHPAAGSTTLQLQAAPTGWNVGDEIVITGTQGSTSDEVRTISAIDGANVTLNSALELDHIPPKSSLNVYVANTTRNVEFTSENTATPNRGHIMFMHNQNVNVKNAKFTELGRTDKKIPLDDVNFLPTDDAVGNRTSAWVDFTTETGPANNIRGRYAIHFHRGGVDPTSTPATIDGSVVVGSPGWGFVNHSSHVNMTNNVAYGVHGASFYTEAGDEIGSIVNNIAIRTVNPDFQLEDSGEVSVDLRADQQDFGVDGDGFWLSGHLVSLRDNISAGASGHGIILWTDGLVETDTGRTSVRVANIENGHLIPGRESIPTWWAPLAEISNNESFNATIGFRSRYVHSSIYLGDPGSAFHEPPPQAYIDTLQPTIDGLTVWGSRDGALMNYNERMSLKNAHIIGIGADYVRQDGTTDLGMGIDMYNDVSRGPGVVENVTVEGFNMGILAPRHNAWQMSNIHLANTTDMLITKGSDAERSLVMDNVTFGDLTGTAVAGNEGQRQNVVMDGAGDENQPYWFLLENRIEMNGQGLYFNEQAASHIPVTEDVQCHFLATIPDEFVGKTNQQLHDQYGTSFGGAIIPEGAESAEFLSGGVVADLPTEEPTSPPLYDMRLDEAVLIDEGTLTNFDGSAAGSGCGEDGGGDDEEDDEGEDDEGEDDEGGDDEDDSDSDGDEEDDEDDSDSDGDEEDDGDDSDSDGDEEDDEDDSDSDEDEEDDEDDSDSDDDEEDDEDDSDSDEDEEDDEDDSDSDEDEEDDEDDSDSDEDEEDDEDDSDSDGDEEDDEDDSDSDEDEEDDEDDSDSDGDEEDDEDDSDSDEDEDDDEDDSDSDEDEDDDEDDSDSDEDEEDDEDDSDSDGDEEDDEDDSDSDEDEEDDEDDSDSDGDEEDDSDSDSGRRRGGRRRGGRGGGRAGAMSSPFMDLDGDGVASPLSDGIVILRHLAGFRGDALTAGLPPEFASRATAALSRFQAADFDVNGDGNVTALEDGISIVREMAGFTPAETAATNSVTPESNELAMPSQRLDENDLDDLFASGTDF